MRVLRCFIGLGPAFAVLIVIFSGVGAAAQTFPALTGRVVDAGGLLDPATEASIVAKLTAFEARSSDQLVVATIASLDGAPLEDYANRLFRAWNLGQASQNNGVLLLVARDDRKIRIEVGYGLEGVLTDLLSRLIIENTMVPAFRRQDFSGGIERAVDDILTVLSGDGAELEDRARRFAEAESQMTTEDWIAVGFFVLVFGLIFMMFVFAILAPIFGRKIGPGRYRWLGRTITYGGPSSGSRRSSGPSGSSWSSGSGGGFSGGGGSSGGGGASGGW